MQAFHTKTKSNFVGIVRLFVFAFQRKFINRGCDEQEVRFFNELVQPLHKFIAPLSVFQKSKRKFLFPYLSFMKNDLIMPEIVEFNSLCCWRSDIDIMALFKDTKGQNKYRKFGIDREQSMIPALIDIDDVIAELYWVHSSHAGAIAE